MAPRRTSPPFASPPPRPSDYFLAKITAVSGSDYGFDEWWVIADGTAAKKVGGRYATAAANPGRSPTGATFAVGDFALARSADGAGGLKWELYPLKTGISTVEEADGSPSIASCFKLQFDQADGFAVSQQAGVPGSARVDLQPATPTQAGGVSTAAQSLAGVKTFRTGVLIGSNDSDSTGLRVAGYGGSGRDYAFYVPTTNNGATTAGLPKGPNAFSAAPANETFNWSNSGFGFPLGARIGAGGESYVSLFSYGGSIVDASTGTLVGSDLLVVPGDFSNASAYLPGSYTIKTGRHIVMGRYAVLSTNGVGGTALDTIWTGQNLNVGGVGFVGGIAVSGSFTGALTGSANTFSAGQTIQAAAGTTDVGLTVLAGHTSAGGSNIAEFKDSAGTLVLGIGIGSASFTSASNLFKFTGTVNATTKYQINGTDGASGTTGGLTFSGGLYTGGTVSAGTVTSVGLTMPSGFAVSGSPVTGAGTLGVTVTGQVSFGYGMVLTAPDSTTPTLRLGKAADNADPVFEIWCGVGGDYLRIGAGDYVTTLSGSASHAMSGTGWYVGYDFIQCGSSTETPNGSTSYFELYENSIVGAYARLTAAARTDEIALQTNCHLLVTGNLDATSGITAAAFFGSGAGLTSLNASNLASGTVAAARLPIGSSVQAWDADLDALAALSGTNTIYYRSAANTWSAVTVGTGLSFSGGTLSATGGSGTVTSVGLSLPAIFSVSGSPVTGSGTLTAALATQSANTVWAGPTTGAAAAPTFRALVTADLPALNGLAAADVGLTDSIAEYNAAASANRTVAVERLLALSRLAPGGRLTLTSGAPVTAADVIGATAIYYTPYVHDLICLWDGTRWVLRQFTEISINIGTPGAGINYDVFLALVGGTVTIIADPWTNNTTRATAVTLQDGRYCKSGDKTRLYVGTFRTSTASATEDSAARRFLWNMYNRVRRAMVRKESGQWNYTTATWRQANGSTANQLMYVCGLAEDAVRVTVQGMVTNGSSVGVAVGVGVDSTTANSADHYGKNTGANVEQIHAFYTGVPSGVGYHYLAWLEYSVATGTTAWYGDASNSTVYQCGISGEVMA